jgi:hypothetical protein
MEIFQRVVSQAHRVILAHARQINNAKPQDLLRGLRLIIRRKAAAALDQSPPCALKGDADRFQNLRLESVKIMGRRDAPDERFRTKKRRYCRTHERHLQRYYATARSRVVA